MGCLNSTGSFNHWFGNIHYSGPCNRSCYFCIGQHMMALDALNNLDKWPLPGFDDFVVACNRHGVKEVNLTGSNTDPLLCTNLTLCVNSLRKEILGVTIGIRTNGVLATQHPAWKLFDKYSVSIPSFRGDIYKQMMGSGNPPDISKIVAHCNGKPLKINIVLGPENIGSELHTTLALLQFCGIKTVNLREPYGQPHVGDPLAGTRESTLRYGMPVYDYNGMEVMYWDVHYVEVESVNLYANGIVSEDYPVTRGHSPLGTVQGQEHWTESGRHVEQWVS